MDNLETKERISRIFMKKYVYLKENLMIIINYYIPLLQNIHRLNQNKEEQQKFV